MDVSASRIGPELDPLIAEAKHRMQRRRLLIALAAALAVAVAVTLLPRPWGRAHALGVAASHTAIAQIPGMTRVHAGRQGAVLGVCNMSVGPAAHGAFFKRAPYPHFCSVLKPRGGWWEHWILTSAYEQGFRNDVKVSFAVALPGPVRVYDEWIRFASPRLAALCSHRR